jgi:hypothetical protein
MLVKKIGTGWAVLLGVGLFLTASAPASACWLCSTEAGSATLSCELVVGETGGTSCSINCKTVLGVDKCFCRTLGVCGGSNGCDGHPCPMVSELLGESVPVKVFLTRDMYRALEESNPDAAMLLANLVKDGDTLVVGLQSRQPFIPGESKGIFAENPTGAPALKRVYHFEASVVQELDRVVVSVRFLDHPTMKSLYAQIRNGDAGNVVEIMDARGRLRRVEM